MCLSFFKIIFRCFAAFVVVVLFGDLYSYVFPAKGRSFWVGDRFLSSATSRLTVLPTQQFNIVPPVYDSVLSFVPSRRFNPNNGREAH